MSNAPPGGSATINGVLYQMLWSLLRALKVHIEEPRHGPNFTIEQTRLILEPRQGGGDLQSTRGATRVVEQLKASADDATWALTDVVGAVLTDLYVAFDPNVPDTAYRFITEGRIGHWCDVYRFFQGLRKRTWDEQKGIDALDDVDELEFKRKQGETWPLSKYTERSMFEHIVNEVRKRKVVEKREDICATRKGVWHMLGRFEFAGEHTSDRVRQEVNSLLLAIVAKDWSLDEKRQALLTGLAEEASKGAATIDSTAFLARYQLDSVPLTSWAVLRENARVSLDGALRRMNYSPEEDVRKEVARRVIRGWNESTPLLALAGESGTGKSWLLYALAQAAASEQEIAIVISASGDADRDCQRAADAFWRTIKNQDDGIALDRIAHRRRELLHKHAGRWLTLLIDNVLSVTEARNLVCQPWEEWGIRVALSCPAEIARTFIQEARARGRVHRLGDFSDPELNGYLGHRLGGNWGDIPADVRSTLRRPLLARLYCDQAAGGGWCPPDEYHLYRACWRRLFEGEHAAAQLDSVGLQKLALNVLDGGPYPWPGRSLVEAGLDGSAVNRLCRSGWLEIARDDRYRVWHDRLLNWAAAEALVAALDAGTITEAELCRRARAAYLSQPSASRLLAYVPMDVLWLLSDPGRAADALVDRLLQSLEG
ncbi:MAG: hypothetical protein U0797_00705 [Gemmataceae bacterium]